MALVAVWPDRYPRSWDGKSDRAQYPVFPNVPIMDALRAEYNSFAHFCPAVLDGEETHPRLTVEAHPSILDRVQFHVIVLDVDAPGKKPTVEWRLGQKEALLNSPWDGAIHYETRGGYRLLWILPQPLAIAQYLATLEALRAVMASYGVIVDPLKDWTRCYALPFVVRDGKPQRLALDESENPIFPLNLLNVASQSETAKPGSIGQAIVSATLPVKAEAGKGDRNKTLFRLLCSLRNLSWLDENTAEEWAHSLNAKFEPPLPESEVNATVRSVWKRYEPKEQDAEQGAVDKTEIRLDPGKLDLVVDQIIQALSGHPNVFHRDGILCRTIGNEIHDYSTASLRTTTAEVATLLKYKASEDGGKWNPTDPPKDLIESVKDHRDYGPMRELQQVHTLPALRPDGILLNSEGYDPLTKALLRPEFLVDIPPHPLLEEALAARDRLLELYCDFPFETEAHRAAALASMMTPILRLTIQGPTPMFVFESSTPGAGKTFMANMVAIAASGESGTPMAPTNEEETAKQITSQLRLGSKVIWIDNVEKPLGGASLDAALTSDKWAARLLGENTMLHLRNTATWLATGNNIRLAGDMGRRVIRVYIDPQMENPEQRDPGQYRFPNILEHVRSVRHDIVRDVLLMARYRHQAGFASTAVGMGSFEQWSYWVRETLMLLGMEDVLTTQEYYRINGKLRTLGTFLYCAEKVFAKNKSFSARDLHSMLVEGSRPGGTEAEISGLMAAYKELMDAPSLSAAADFLNRWKGRVLNNRRLVQVPGDNTQTSRYVVEDMTQRRFTLVQEAQA